MTEIPNIQKTGDYTIFKILNFNRQKSKKHIEEIKRLVTNENLLHLHPILVNENMEVIDGQHRLEAAKALNLEIFYIQDKISYEHILTSNLYQQKLTLKDTIKFFAIKDAIPSYLFLYNCVQETSLSPKALIALFFSSNSKSIIEFIKSGKFEMPSNRELIQKLLDSLKKFLVFAVEKRIKPFSMFSSSLFSIGYRNLVLFSDFKEEIWFNKLEQRWFDLKPQLNSQEWTRQLLGIYNWKNQNPLT